MTIRDLTDHLPEVKIPAASLHHFLQRFIGHYPDTCFRLVHLGGIGDTPCLMYGANGEPWALPLLWHDTRNCYVPAVRSLYDNNQLVVPSMTVFALAYPHFAQMAKTIYSPIPA